MLVQWALGSCSCMAMLIFMWPVYQQFLYVEGIDAMDWPACSPDLDPIEHLWDIMSRTICQRNVAPQTVQELTDALMPCTMPVCPAYRHGMPCIQARGGHTHN